MGSYTNLTYHIVFATKYRRETINDSCRTRLYEYMGGIIRAQKGSLIEIGGVSDHVHILTNLSPTIAVANTIRDIKANSSAWMHQHAKVGRSFEWQKGYGAFTVSCSQVKVVAQYIQNQVAHHQRISFRDEYIAILKKHNIQFQPEYLFEREHHG